MSTYAENRHEIDSAVNFDEVYGCITRYGTYARLIHDLVCAVNRIAASRVQKAVLSAEIQRLLKMRNLLTESLQKSIESAVGILDEHAPKA